MTRYSRQRMLAEVGDEGQRRLNAARVLIVGVGGLGSPVAMYLAAAGVGTIRLADDDSVSLDNLQRQILYTEADISSPKAECAARRLRAMNIKRIPDSHCITETGEHSDGPHRLAAHKAEQRTSVIAQSSIGNGTFHIFRTFWFLCKIGHHRLHVNGV